MYSINEKGEVVLTMSVDDHTALLRLMGSGLSGVDNLAYFFRLINRLEEGNPHFAQYSTPDEDGNMIAGRK